MQQQRYGQIFFVVETTPGKVFTGIKGRPKLYKCFMDALPNAIIFSRFAIAKYEGNFQSKVKMARRQN